MSFTLAVFSHSCQYVLFVHGVIRQIISSAKCQGPNLNLFLLSLISAVDSP